MVGTVVSDTPVVDGDVKCVASVDSPIGVVISVKPVERVLVEEPD
jgi:hypothetical protein